MGGVLGDFPRRPPKPLVATPCYGNQICVNYVVSLLRLRPTPEVTFTSGSLITHIRNQLVAKFMGGDWTHLFFIDADVGFVPASFLRLLLSGHDVVAGAYPYKSDDTAWQGGFVVDPAEVGPIGDGGFATIQNAPTGFMCIKREVFERMAAAGIGKDEFFDTMRVDGEYLAEDHAFCRRWRDLDGTIHIDTMAELTHQGTKIYQRDFQAILQEYGK